MTLVMALNVGARYSIMTTDIRKVKLGYWFDTKTGEYTPIEGHIEAEEGEYEKVTFLSKYVMMGAGGISDLCTYLLEKMSEIVNEDDDLEDCTIKLNELIHHIRENPKAEYHTSFIDEEKGAIVILNGFNRDRSGGLNVFESKPGAEIRKIEIPELYVNWAMIPPEEEYYELGNQLQEDVENQFIAANKALNLHAQISFKERIKVSSECHYFIITLDENGQSAAQKGEFDTSIWYEAMEQLATQKE